MNCTKTANHKEAGASKLALAFLLLTVTVVTAGCQNVIGTAQPARLDSPEKSVQQMLQKRVSYALGSNVILSSRALTDSNRLIIDAPRPKSINGHRQGMDLGRPDHFTLWKQGKQCILKHEESEREWVLEDARCIAEK
ncbi:hypothetical protein QWI17_18550 [Gilvimarinus sp. SDUM040013]|uniref:Lipoprotein n=1 Tax=Gilvimarinus gilvus TaxID=3058038 RepID=A0ABU4RYU1_9GAMM|nr:hypothetical protein [Gilvimarinus sp. SDUM040013]MDO3387851.1 hypothetical protein [Gilvimarinus sp. SDUM040013]MDX6848778.1 hypothetical protein [Gilvimarinus sp. SDUM040013]